MIWRRGGDEYPKNCDGWAMNETKMIQKWGGGGGGGVEILN